MPVSWQKKSLLCPVAFPFQRGQSPFLSSEGWTSRRHKWTNIMSCTSHVGWQWRAASLQGFAGAACPAFLPGHAAEAQLSSGARRDRILHMEAGAGSAATAHAASLLHFPLLSVTHWKFWPTFTPVPCQVNYCLNSPLEMQSIVRAWSVIIIKSLLVRSPAWIYNPVLKCVKRTVTREAGLQPFAWSLGGHEA